MYDDVARFTVPGGDVVQVTWSGVAPCTHPPDQGPTAVHLVVLLYPPDMQWCTLCAPLITGCRSRRPLIAIMSMHIVTFERQVDAGADGRPRTDVESEPHDPSYLMGNKVARTTCMTGSSLVADGIMGKLSDRQLVDRRREVATGKEGVGSVGRGSKEIRVELRL